MILIRPRTIVVVALTILVFTASVSVLSALKAAPASFAASNVFVISDSSAPTIFSSHVDASIAPMLDSFENITGTSSEIFAFSSWDGVSYTIRGVDFEDLTRTGPKLEQLRLFGGTSLANGSSALVGSGLLERLGINLPTIIPLVGSYSPKVEFVKVIGTFTSGSPLDDEMLVSLDVARTLSGMPQGKVSIIRVATSEPEWLEALLSPNRPQFLIYDLRLSSGVVPRGGSVGATVGVKNWGKASGSVVVHFSVESEEVASRSVELGPSESAVVTERVFVGAYVQNLSSYPAKIDAWIEGEIPMSISTSILVTTYTCTIEAPAFAALGREFNVTILDVKGDPAVGAAVTFQDDFRFIDASGQTSLHANYTGTFDLRAGYNGDVVKKGITVYDYSGQPNEFLPSIVSFSVSPESIKEDESATGTVVLQNSGFASGTYELTVLVDDDPYFNASVFIDVLGTVPVRFSLEDLSVGTHVAQAGDYAVQLEVQSWIADNPDLIELLIKYGGTGVISRADSIPISQAAKISEGNISVALTAIGSVSALLAALGITAIFSKEIHQSRRRLGILKTIGATSGDVRKLVFPQALENGLAGAAIGVAAGIILLDVLSKSTTFLIFGHKIEFSYNAGLLVLIMIGAVVIGVASALVSAMIAVRETTIASVRRLPEEAGPEVDVAELLGDE